MRSIPAASVALRSFAPVPSGSDLESIRAWRVWLASAFERCPSRFAHSVGVADHVRRLRQSPPAWLDPGRAQTLELAALLHDVGRAIDPEDRAPHGFVGARFLADVGLGQVAPLVAHHSGARFEALARDMSHLDEWTDRDLELSCVLTCFDRITSPEGAVITVQQRRADLLRRYPAGSVRVVSFDLAAADAERGWQLAMARPASPEVGAGR